MASSSREFPRFALIQLIRMTRHALCMRLEKHLDAVLDTFPVDVSSTASIEIEGLRQDTSVFKVDTENSPLIPRGVDVGEVFIVDTVPGMRIACHPHIVGEELESLCLDGSREFVRALMGLDLLDVSGLAVLHILRAGSGYMVGEALPDGVPVISVRTEYGEDGYRSHSDARTIGVSYRDYSSGDSLMDGVDTLLIPDTYATGRSAETALGDLLESGLSPERIVLYGFIAIPALVKLGGFCSEEGIDLFSFSICDIAQLGHNKYDMPLYGLDESLFVSAGETRCLGSIVDVQTLRAFLPIYVAGLDQPGDWSERQRSLFDGFSSETGDIVGHLRKSVGLVESLREINSVQPWYDDFHDGIALVELGRLREAVREYE